MALLSTPFSDAPLEVKRCPMIKLDGRRDQSPLHRTWELRYLEAPASDPKGCAE